MAAHIKGIGSHRQRNVDSDSRKLWIHEPREHVMELPEGEERWEPLGKHHTNNTFP